MTTERADDFVVTDERDSSQYTLTNSDGTPLAVMNYQDDGQTLMVLRVFTVPAQRGHGYAARLVKSVVEEIEQRGDRKIGSVCWFASGWLAEHPEHQHLLR